MAHSRHGTAILAGSIKTDPFRPPPPGPSIYRYDELLDRYANTFSKESVNPRIYDRIITSDGGVIGDFLQTLGVDYDPEVKEPRANRAIDPAVLELIDRSTSEVRFPGGPADRFGRLRRLSRLHHPSRRPQLPSASLNTFHLRMSGCAKSGSPSSKRSFLGNLHRCRVRARVIRRTNPTPNDSAQRVECACRRLHRQAC